MEFKGMEKVNGLKCAIVCGAPIGNLLWLKEQLKGYECIVAADSGYDHLSQIGITPNILIGDLDSISAVPKDVEIIKYPSKKDVTDFSICLEYCLGKKLSDVDVYCAWGNRADHSLASVFTMLEYHKQGMNIRIISEKSEMFFVNNKHVLPRHDGYVSIFPLDCDAEVSLTGFEYPLNNYLMKSCSPLGVSNSIVENFGEISVKSGSVLVILQKE